MGKLIDVNKWFKDTFPKADLDYPILDNLKAYPHWSTDITGLVTILSDAESIEAIPKDQYEARLNADMVAMLEDLDLQIDELLYKKRPFTWDDTGEKGIMDIKPSINDVRSLIQEHIDALRGGEN